MKILKIIVFSVGLIIVVDLVYSVVVIFCARTRTPAIVEDALNSERVKLELSDLTTD